MIEYFKVTIVLIICVGLLLCSCDKIGVGGMINQAIGDWAEVRLPPGCKVKQIAAEKQSGALILCEDGRVFH